jgi:hypothetical protein
VSEVNAKVTVATVLITKSFVVAAFELPATSDATPFAIRSKSFPGVFAVPDEFVAVNVYTVVDTEVRVAPIVQPLEAASLVISLISSPLTDSLKVAVIVNALV